MRECRVPGCPRPTRQWRRDCISHEKMRRNHPERYELEASTLLVDATFWAKVDACTRERLAV